jgi:glycolate oxidase FAD binding subunit
LTAPPITSEAFEGELRRIVGSGYVRACEPGDAVAGVLPRVVVEPADEREIAAVLACANDAGMAVIPRGGGTKMEWGNPPARADVLLSLARLDRVVEHAWADMTVTVEAGCAVVRLQETLAEHGQRLAIDALWPERATVGGILSANDSGALRLRFGGLRDLVIGVTLALADGTLARSGGKVVKNVAGYDLPKLATGALGTLGVITQATFRLHPAPRNARTLSFTAPDHAEAERLVLGIQDAKLAHSALQVRAAGRLGTEVDLLLEGTEAGIAGQEATIRNLAGRMQALDRSDLWSARQDLWQRQGAIAKVSFLPADLAETMEAIRRAAQDQSTLWEVVLYAHGVGWVRLDGSGRSVTEALGEVRWALAAHGGSLVVARQPDEAGHEHIDAWGDAGDARPLVRAVKQQFDPRGILNPGRFVGGI